MTHRLCGVRRHVSKNSELNQLSDAQPRAGPTWRMRCFAFGDAPGLPARVQSQSHHVRHREQFCSPAHLHRSFRREFGAVWRRRLAAGCRRGIHGLADGRERFVGRRGPLRHRRRPRPRLQSRFRLAPGLRVQRPFRGAWPPSPVARPQLTAEPATSGAGTSAPAAVPDEAPAPLAVAAAVTTAEPDQATLLQAAVSDGEATGSAPSPPPVTGAPDFAASNGDASGSLGPPCLIPVWNRPSRRPLDKRRRRSQRRRSQRRRSFRRRRLRGSRCSRRLRRRRPWRPLTS